MSPSKPTQKPAADAAPPVALFGADGQPAPYEVFARRYRSRTFGEVVGQETIARTLQNAIALGRTAHAYLFCGTRGVGKTSMARIFARALNAVESLSQQDAIADSIMRGQDLDVIEIDGASNRGVDDARDLIAGAGMAPARSPFKIYIIDEVHMLTQPAFNALLKTMEEPPSHVKFILCTTEPHKVPATIQSRCQRYDFKSIPTQAIAAHMRSVLQRESVTADEAVVLQVARLANGSMRDGLSLLDRLVAAASGHVSSELARDVLGLPDEELLERLMAAIAACDPAAGLAAAGELLDHGMSCDHALDTIAARLRDALLLLLSGTDANHVDLPEEAKQRLAAHAARFDAPALVHLIALCDASVRSVRSSAVPRAIFDAVVARLCMSEHFLKATALLAGEPQAEASEAARGGGAKKKVGAEVGGSSTGRAAPPVTRSVAPPVAATPVAAVPASPPMVRTESVAPRASVPAPQRVTPRAGALSSPASREDAEAIRRNPVVREIAQILDATVGAVALQGDIVPERDATVAPPEGESAP
ncbi:MAG: DNA polymerase III subunit gamma/tau [Planctomycetes bacterium]|nr:DNA polymerase III subunit gamma/tau [Planctomycetota bacterium]